MKQFNFKRVHLYLGLFLLSPLVVFSACKSEKQISENASQSSVTKAVEEGSSEAACHYAVDPKDIQIQWIAYKYTEKAPVMGTFNTYEIKGSKSAADLETLVKGLKVEIDASSVESNNAGRNATIREYFFQKFTPAFLINGEVESFSGDEKSGDIVFKINMNNVSYSIPMKYQIDAENNFNAEGKFTMEDFKLKAAFDSIHEACKSLHTGEDGVSKTWEEVGLKISAKYQKECS
ncbi:MAG: YceI family protein [Deltaproteobacteria bacterium]|nr:YceI family protein [Deltaproteobacteria bacterium]